MDSHLLVGGHTLQMSASFSRTLQDENNSNIFSPSLEGYLTLEFSLYLPDLANDVGTLTQQNVQDIEKRLDSLLLQFLCSQDVDVIVSPSPESLVSVCPYRGDRRRLAGFLQSMADKFRRVLQSEDYEINDPTGMVLWNVPKIDSDILLLGNGGDQQAAVEDSDEYYTQWTFTYPVYNWGPFIEGVSSQSDEFKVQTQLDNSITDGTFDVILPWEDSQASVVGKEMQTFRNVTFGADDEYADDAINGTAYDNEIPLQRAKLLQGIGSTMVILNTFFLILVTVLAKKQRIRKEKQAKERAEKEATGLDTEEGVTEMLLESKIFAMEQRRSRTVDTASSGSLGTAFAAAPHAHNDSKERSLVVQAIQHKHAYDERLLASNRSMDEEDYDVDFRPPSPFRHQSKIPRAHHSKRKSRTSSKEDEC
jgi:hypothetical protein